MRPPICALMGMTILMALGAALVAITSTETIIAGNFRNSTQAFYVAEAAAEFAVAELRTRTHWIGVVEGYRTIRSSSTARRAACAGFRRMRLST